MGLLICREGIPLNTKDLRDTIFKLGIDHQLSTYRSSTVATEVLTRLCEMRKSSSVLLFEWVTHYNHLGRKRWPALTGQNQSGSLNDKSHFH